MATNESQSRSRSKIASRVKRDEGTGDFHEEVSRSTSRPPNSDDLENVKIRDKLRSHADKARYARGAGGPLLAKPLASAPTSPGSGSPTQIPRNISSGDSPTTRSRRHRARVATSEDSTTSPQSQNEVRSPSPVRCLEEESLERRIERTKRANLYFLQQPGPHSFLVGTEYSSNTSGRYRVMIGPQSCTCSRAPQCIHLLFVMLRVLKVPENDPKLSRKKLRNYEVEALFRNYQNRKQARLKNSPVDKTNEGYPHTKEPNNSQRSSNSNRCSEDENLCSICLLEMRDGQIFSRCNLACQNTFHKKCVSVWFEECRAQNESLTCPLCRAVWETPNQSPSSTPPTPPPNHPSSTGRLLPASPPAPDPDYAEWVVHFGTNVGQLLLSTNWDHRESALKQVAQMTVRRILEGEENLTSSRLCPTIKAAFKVACKLLDYHVYNVFVAALRAFREILGYLVCQSTEEQRCLQRLISPILRRLLRLSSDSHARKAQLVLSALVELARGQRGLLAVGREVKTDSLGIGGVEHLVSFILMSSQFHAEHLLGRLIVLDRLLDQFPVPWGQLKPSLTFAARHVDQPPDPPPQPSNLLMTSSISSSRHSRRDPTSTTPAHGFMRQDSSGTSSTMSATSTARMNKTVRQARKVFVTGARLLLNYHSPTHPGMATVGPGLLDERQCQGEAIVERLLSGMELGLQERMRKKLDLAKPRALLMSVSAREVISSATTSGSVLHGGGFGVGAGGVGAGGSGMPGGGTSSSGMVRSYSVGVGGGRSQRESCAFVRITPEPAYDSVAPSEASISRRNLLMDDCNAAYNLDTVSFRQEVISRMGDPVDEVDGNPIDEEEEEGESEITTSTTASTNQVILEQQDSVEEEVDDLMLLPDIQDADIIDSRASLRRSSDELLEATDEALTRAMQIQTLRRQNPLPLIPGLQLQKSVVGASSPRQDSPLV